MSIPQMDYTDRYGLQLVLRINKTQMKKITSILTISGLLLTFTGCEKLKFDDEPYLKYTMNGTEYSYGEEALSADILEINGIELWSFSKGSPAGENSFYIQSRTDIALDTPYPLIEVIETNQASLYIGNVYYKLYNGVVKLKHMSTTSGGNSYMEGTFSMSLINNTNNTDTIHVSNGSFFHNNY